MSDDEYEYDYSDGDEDDYVVEDMDDDGQAGMDWTGTDNPQTPTTISGQKTGIRMLPAQDLVPEMEQRLKDVSEILDVPPVAAAVLLRAHNWSKERLMEVFYNDAESLMKKCGVYNRCMCASVAAAAAAVKGKGKGTSAGGSGNDVCSICYDDLEMGDDKKLAMPCGHEFCMDCWHDFCVNAIQEEGPSCVLTTCPQSGCGEVLTEVEVAKAAPEFLQKFQTYQIRSYVECNTLTRWCPGKGCEQIACAANASAAELEGNVAHCNKCMTNFCIMCGEEPHSPCGCKDLAKWNEKCRNESETANWILANTKSCPKCCSRIEKNQGCNHMTCQRCKYEFCWICMGDWNDHGSNTGGYYKCNKYDTSNNSEDQSDAARAKRELDRYLHYYKRYHAHDEAQKFAQKQLKETEARMILLQESSENVKWSDVEFLKAANEQLVECRRVLKYTYAFAYYMNPTALMQKERFEHHQEMLERFTEDLSELSEKPLDQMDRTAVVNQTRVVDRFMKNILTYVEEGMEEGFP